MEGRPSHGKAMDQDRERPWRGCFLGTLARGGLQGEYPFSLFRPEQCGDCRSTVRLAERKEFGQNKIAYSLTNTLYKSEQMRTLIIATLLIFTSTQSFAQSSIEQEIKELSKAKWQWMADKDVDKLKSLFHDKAKFVHMSGSWKKDRELEIIESGSIWYKQADVH